MPPMAPAAMPMIMPRLVLEELLSVFESPPLLPPPELPGPPVALGTPPETPVAYVWSTEFVTPAAVTLFSAALQ